MEGFASKRLRKPFPQFGPSLSPGNIPNRYRYGLVLSDDHNKALSSGEAGVEKIALKHGIVRVEIGRITAGNSEPCALCMVVA